MFDRRDKCLDDVDRDLEGNGVASKFVEYQIENYRVRGAAFSRIRRANSSTIPVIVGREREKEDRERIAIIEIELRRSSLSVSSSRRQQIRALIQYRKEDYFLFSQRVVSFHWESRWD